VVSAVVNTFGGRRTGSNRAALGGVSLKVGANASDSAAYYDGSNVVAAYSQDQTVIRVLAEHDFVLRHDTAFAMVESVTWGD
jgi:hypothetical protein